MTQAQSIDAPTAHAVAGRRATRVTGYAGWLVAALSFIAVAPTLPWLEFSNGSEQLHAATVLEMRREGGSWVMPTLNGVWRIQKPPLPAWIGALAVSDSTLDGVASADPDTRDRAYARLAWEIRWPALLVGCLTLAAVFDLARTLAGGRAALWATLILATSLLFLRYTRLASTDIHLMFWVTAANAMIARVLLRRQRWMIVAAGLAIGCAFMSKGPVAILQTIVPALAGMLLVRRGGPAQPSLSEPRRLLVPLLLAIVAFLAVALPWPILVWMSHDRALEIWWREITREGATDHEYGPIWSYLSLLPSLIPWLPAFLVGCVLTLRRRKRATASTAPLASPRPVLRQRGYLLALCWLMLPIVVMSLARDKNERYLLPLLPVAAILAARGLLAMFAGIRRGRHDAGAWLGSHAVIVTAIVLVVPVVGILPANLLPRWLASNWPTRFGGGAWYGPLIAGAATIIAVAGWLAMLRLLRAGRSAAMAAVVTGLMLAANVLSLWNYSYASASQSPMRPIAERVLSHAPGATVAYYDPGGSAMPQDLPIYLNRVIRPLPVIRKHGGPEPQIIVALQRSADPPTIQGWKAFASERHGSRTWHALEPIQE